MHIDDFNIRSDAYISIVLKMYLTDYWWLYALPVLVIFSLAALNFNFIYVGFMALCLIFPMVRALVIAAYALQPEMSWSLLHKTLDLTDEGLHLTFFPNKNYITYDDEDNDNAETREQQVGDTNDYETAQSLPEPFTLTWQEIDRAVPHSEHLLIMLKSHRYTFLAIPYTAFTDKEHLRQFVLTLRKYVKCEE